MFILQSSLTQLVVSNLKKLTHFGLYDQQVRGWKAATPEQMEVFNSLKDLPQLEHLHLRFTYAPVSERLQALRSFSKLKSLSIECSWLDEPESLMSIAHLNKLESLKIGTLFLDCSKEAWNATWQELIQRLPDLKDLTINSNGLFDESLQGLSSLTKLESIDLTESGNITDGIVNHLSPVPSLKTIKITEQTLSPEAKKALEDAGKTVICCPKINYNSDSDED